MTETTPEDQDLAAVMPDLQAAVAHHAANRLDEAEVLYEKVLARIPDLGDALHMLGQLALTRGQADRAVDLIERAIEDYPEDVFEPHVNLGNAHAAAGHPEKAEASYRRALAINPACAPAHANLAGRLNARGAFQEALASCEAALPLDPALPHTHLNHAIALRGLFRAAEAEGPLRKALALQPDRVDTIRDLAGLLRQLNRYREALPLNERAVALRPNDPALLLELGTTWERLNDAEQARRQYQRAVAIAPGLAAAWMAAGRAERALGQFPAAADCFRRALAIDPSLSEARWHLSASGRQTADSDDAGHLRTMLARQDLPEENRIVSLFTLAKIMDDDDAYDEAFPLFAEGNARFRALRASQGERFDPVALRGRVDGLIGAFQPRVFQDLMAWGNASDLPVFIVGMPRSGTTLVEQIIASHGQVFGAGELADIPAIVRELAERNRDQPSIGRWDAAHARGFANSHISRLAGLAAGQGAEAAVLRVVDKLPDNIFHLGLIAALFPRARIILVDRDDRDTGLSNFFQFFTFGNLFASDLADTGLRIRETGRLARHWRDALPGHVMTVRYEALVDDLEGQARRLIAFLGLDWDPACLRFHETARTVATPSMWQVRQPISRRSIGRWRHYERHLGPLFEALSV